MGFLATLFGYQDATHDVYRSAEMTVDADAYRGAYELAVEAADKADAESARIAESDQIDTALETGDFDALGAILSDEWTDDGYNW